MSANEKQISIYCQGTFDIENPTSAQQQQMLTDAQELASSGFGTVLLGQWHTHVNNGKLNIYYNDALYVPGDENLQWALSTIPKTLKAGSVANVLVTFGPFGSDFDPITAHLDEFQQQIQYLFTHFAIDGIDFDIEQELTPANQQALAKLSNWAAAQGKIVTGAPYYDQDWWNQLLTEAPKTNWWNLQAYAGGNDTGMYVSWVAGLQGVPSQSPVNAQSFLSYGFKPANDISTDEVTSTLQGLRQNYPDLDSAFIWRYEDIRGQAASYYQAITAGLS